MSSNFDMIQVYTASESEAYINMRLYFIASSAR
jgi:hypothetical protein